MKTFTAFILFALANFSFGQVPGNVYGTILSSNDSITPVSGVFVDLNGFQRVLSNSRGEFILNEIAPGNYPLVLRHVNYGIERLNLEIRSGVNLQLKIYLTEGVMDLPETVVSHSTIIGGEKGIKDLSGSAYYLSPKELEKFNNSDINRILRNVPGVNLQEEDGFGLRPNIGLRGSGVERSSKITLMEDGILMAPAPYSAPSAYYFPTIGRMQGVEVLKGSSQIKYGPYTTGGAINLISTQIPDTLTARIRLTGGNFGYRNLHAFAGNSHKYFAYSVETFQISSDGFKELQNGGNTGFVKSDYLVKLRVNTKSDAKVYQALSFKFGESQETSNETYLGLSRSDFDSNPYMRYAGSQMDQMNNRQHQLSISHYIKPAKFLSLTTTAYRTDFFRDWYKLDAVRDSSNNKNSISKILDAPQDYEDCYNILNGQTSAFSNSLYVKGNSRDHYSRGVQTLVNAKFKTGLVNHNLDLGIRIHEDEQDRFQYQDEYAMVDGVMMLTKTGEAGRESNQVTSASAAASYLQYHLKIKRFDITTGLRHEYISVKKQDYGKNDPERTGIDLSENKNSVSVFIPGLSAQYKLSTKMSLFTGIHKGFAPPGAIEETNPEESINIELGYKFYTDGISVQLVGFFNDYKNLLGSDLAASGGAGSGDLFNGGKAQVQGVEIHGTYDVMRHLKGVFNIPITVSYTYTDAFFKSSFESEFEDWGTVKEGDRLPYLAHHQFAINASLEHARFSINLSGKYTSDVRAVAGNGEIQPDDLIPSFFLMDMSTHFHMNKHFTVFGSVSNIFNEVYIAALRPAGYRPGMPRFFQLGLKARL